ncbi:MAG: glycosyltransferase family 39 protein [Vicinamibacterales bacterium]
MNPAAAGSSRRPSARLDSSGGALLVAAAAVCAAAVLLRVAMSPQFDGMDDAGYLDAAQRVSDGRSLEGLFPLFRTRVGMAYPLGWLLHAGWLAANQFWILTTAAECITLLCLFAIGRVLAGARAGLAAMVLYAVYPIAVQQSAMFYPTAFQVMFIALAVLLTCVAEARAASAGWRWGGALAAGASLGLGYLVKEDVAIVVPAILLASLVTGFPRRSIAIGVCAGAAAVFSLECVGYEWSTGHALFRLTATAGLAAQEQGQLQIAQIWKWDAFLRSLFVLPVQVGLLWWLAVPAVWAAWRRGDARLRFLAVAFLGLAAYLQFGSGSLSSYVPLPKTPRYTALLTPFVILLVGTWLAWTFERGRQLRAAAALALVVIAAVPCTAYLAIASNERTRNTLAVLPALRDLEPEPLYTDYYGARVLRVLEPGLPQVNVWYHAHFATREMVVTSNPGSARDAYVLLDRQAAKVYTSSYEMTLPEQVTHPPATWTLVWTHRAYGDGTWARSILEGVRQAAGWLPNGNPLSSRINRDIADLIDGDEAMLYKIAPPPIALTESGS